LLPSAWEVVHLGATRDSDGVGGNFEDDMVSRKSIESAEKQSCNGKQTIQLGSRGFRDIDSIVT
jgi:hypothetical protein